MNFSLLRSAWITAKVAARSTGAFANARTFLVGIVLTPLLGVAFNVLLGQGIGAPELMPIAWASLVLGVFGMSASTLNGIVVHDRMIGVFDEVITRNRVPLPYWLGISLPAIGTALVTGSILSATFLLITGEFSYYPFAYLVVPSAILGALFRVFCAGMGAVKDNPYTYLNWSLTFLPPHLRGSGAPSVLSNVDCTSFAVGTVDRTCASVARKHTPYLHHAGIHCTDFSCSRRPRV